MNKNILAGILGVAAIGVVIYQIMFTGGGTTPPPQPSAGDAAGAPAAVVVPAGPTRLTTVDVNIDELLKGVQEVTFDYEAMRISRDPLAALVGGPINQTGGPVTATGGVIEIMRKKITGIIYDSNNPLAVVDDEVVGIGYTYPNGVKVHAIEKDKVIFQLGDSLIPVEMKEL